MRCLNCGHELKAGAGFCGRCGTKVLPSVHGNDHQNQTVRANPVNVDLRTCCPSCGHELKAGARFCVRCGAEAVGQDPLAAPSDWYLGQTAPAAAADVWRTDETVPTAALHTQAQYPGNHPRAQTTADQLHAPAPAQCPSCGHELKAGARFCVRCGAEAAGQDALATPSDWHMGQAASAAAADVWQTGETAPTAALGTQARAQYPGNHPRAQTTTDLLHTPARTQCPSCGHELKAGARFCVRCGAEAVGQDAWPQPQQIRPPQFQQDPVKAHQTRPPQLQHDPVNARQRRVKPWVLVLIGVLVLALGLSSVYFYPQIKSFLGFSGGTGEQMDQWLEKPIEPHEIPFDESGKFTNRVPEYRANPCTGCEIHAPEGALDKPRDFVVKPMEPLELMEIAAEVKDPAVTFVEAWHFDSGLKEDERYPGLVTVKLDLKETDVPEALYPSLQVYHRSDSGELTLLNTALEGDQLHVQTDRNACLVAALTVTAAIGLNSFLAYKLYNRPDVGGRITPLVWYESNKKLFHDKMSIKASDGKYEMADLGNYSLYWDSKLPPTNPDAFKEVSTAINTLFDTTLPLIEEALSPSQLAELKKDPEAARKHFKEEKKKLYEAYLAQIQVVNKLQDKDWVVANLYPKTVGDAWRAIELADHYLYELRGFKRTKRINVIFHFDEEYGMAGEQKSAVMFTFDQQLHIKLHELNKFYNMKHRDKDTINKYYMEELDDIMLTATHEMFHASQDRYIGESFFGDTVLNRDVKRSLWIMEATAVVLEREAERYYQKQEQHPLFPNVKGLRYGKGTTTPNDVATMTYHLNGPMTVSDDVAAKDQGYSSGYFLEFVRDKYFKDKPDEFLAQLWTYIPSFKWQNKRCINYVIRSTQVGTQAARAQINDLSPLEESYQEFMRLDNQRNTQRQAFFRQALGQKSTVGEAFNSYFQQQKHWFDRDNPAKTIHNTLSSFSNPHFLLEMDLSGQDLSNPKKLRLHINGPNLPEKSVELGGKWHKAAEHSATAEINRTKTLNESVDIVSSEGERAQISTDLPFQIMHWKNKTASFIFWGLAKAGENPVPCTYQVLAMYEPDMPDVSLESEGGKNGEDIIKIQLPDSAFAKHHLPAFYNVEIQYGEERYLLQGKSGEMLSLPLRDDGLLDFSKEENRRRMVEALQEYTEKDPEQLKQISKDLFDGALTTDQIAELAAESLRLMQDEMDYGALQRAARVLTQYGEAAVQLEVRIQEIVDAGTFLVPDQLRHQGGLFSARQKETNERDLRYGPVSKPVSLVFDKKIGSDKSMIGKWQGKPFMVDAKVTMTFSEATIPGYDYDILVESTNKDLFPTSDQGSESVNLHYVGKELGEGKVQIGYWTEENKMAAQALNPDKKEIPIINIGVLIKSTDNECYLSAPPITLKRIK